MTFSPHCVTLSSAFHTRYNCSQAYTLLSFHFHNSTPRSMIIRFVCLGQFFFLYFIGRQASQHAIHLETDYDSYSTMSFVYLLPGV